MFKFWSMLEKNITHLHKFHYFKLAEACSLMNIQNQTTNLSAAYYLSYYE